ncbi:MAG: DinB family protein [Acidobacteriota bacterium]|jgi:hypothetical protein
MSAFWNEVMGRQYVTAIEMLRNTIDACPDELWDDRSDGTPFWHIAYHALFFCDLYLSDDLESFRARDYHVDNYHFLPGDYKEYAGIVTTPDECYSRQQMLEYADHCTEKCRGVFAALTEQRARERCGFWWYKLNVGEFLINSLRHTQHHAAQLALILRRRVDIGIDWLGTEHNEPPPPTW